MSFWATPATHGGSWARGRFGAIAAGLHHSHSNARSEPHLWPMSQLTVNPLSGARNWTLILTDISKVPYRWATTGTPEILKPLLTQFSFDSNLLFPVVKSILHLRQNISCINSEVNFFKGERMSERRKEERGHLWRARALDKRLGIRWVWR